MHPRFFCTNLSYPNILHELFHQINFLVGWSKIQPICKMFHPTCQVIMLTLFLIHDVRAHTTVFTLQVKAWFKVKLKLWRVTFKVHVRETVALYLTEKANDATETSKDQFLLHCSFGLNIGHMLWHCNLRRMRAMRNTEVDHMANSLIWVLHHI